MNRARHVASPQSACFAPAGRAARAVQGSPGVVVIQEWWGVDAEVLEHAKKLAEHGYRALVPGASLPGQRLVGQSSRKAPAHTTQTPPNVLSRHQLFLRVL